MRPNHFWEGRALRTAVEILVLALLSGSITGTAMPATSTPNSFADSWVFVFTYREAPLPDEAINFFCNDVKNATISWFEREATKYGTEKPFSDIICTQKQVLLSGNLLKGEPLYVEGTLITNPLNDAAVIEFLEDQNPALKKAKYVTVFHYMPEQPFVAHAYSNKYDMIFTVTNDGTLFYPRLTIDNYGEMVTHELLHNLGARDKYDGTGQACLTDPATGQQYSSYDIMCHRVATAGGFTFPPFSELIVTGPTAKEINWKSKLPPPPVPEVPTIILTVLGLIGLMVKIRRNR